uniref:Uncharacterized protein n=1 Tax=Anguilla anguilla TaxID=7936 RepID=A0A0E9PX76_ANGAN
MALMLAEESEGNPRFSSEHKLASQPILFTPQLQTTNVQSRG